MNLLVSRGWLWSKLVGNVNVTTLLLKFRSWSYRYYFLSDEMQRQRLLDISDIDFWCYDLYTTISFHSKVYYAVSPKTNNFYLSRRNDIVIEFLLVIHSSDYHLKPMCTSTRILRSVRNHAIYDGDSRDVRIQDVHNFHPSPTITASPNNSMRTIPNFT